MLNFLYDSMSCIHRIWLYIDMFISENANGQGLFNN